MRLLIATVQVPFIWGGAEILAQGLKRALLAAGHQAEIVAVPYKWYPPERIPEQMLACRLLDLTESCGDPVDRIIGLKFPAYLIPHANKVLWLLHQHRQAYDLWDNRHSDLMHYSQGAGIRDTIRQADSQMATETRAIYTISGNVSQRLQKYNGVKSTPLYHPPQHAEQFYCDRADDYLFFPSRITLMKRQTLVLQGLAQTRHPVRVHFAGRPDHAGYGEEVQKLTHQLGVQDRVKWLGDVSEEEKRRSYARARGVVYPPFDEDLGYVTLEGMLASKPVLTCSDSGGALEFIRHEYNGLIADPTPQAMAAALDQLWSDPRQAAAWGANGRKHYEDLEINWPHVVRRLVS